MTRKHRCKLPRTLQGHADIKRVPSELSNGQALKQQEDVCEGPRAAPRTVVQSREGSRRDKLAIEGTGVKNLMRCSCSGNKHHQLDSPSSRPRGSSRRDASMGHALGSHTTRHLDRPTHQLAHREREMTLQKEFGVSLPKQRGLHISQAINIHVNVINRYFENLWTVRR